MSLHNFDLHLINLMRRYFVPVSRFALFVIFFWFGLLKVLGYSPASGLVQDLLTKTLPYMEASDFIFYFGLFEMLIGLMFAIKGLERVVIPLLALHMITTFMPLILLPTVTWTSSFVPTLEGQYIIKNLVIIATAIGIATHLHPIKEKVLMA